MRMIKFTAYGDVKLSRSMKKGLLQMETPYEVEFIDIEQFPNKKEQYTISIIPTYIVVDQNNVEQKRLEGLASEEFIRGWLDE